MSSQETSQDATINPSDVLLTNEQPDTNGSQELFNLQQVRLTESISEFIPMKTSFSAICKTTKQEWNDLDTVDMMDWENFTLPTFERKTTEDRDYVFCEVHSSVNMERGVNQFDDEIIIIAFTNDHMRTLGDGEFPVALIPIIVEYLNLFDGGVRLMKEGHLSEAILLFEDFVRSKPERSEAWRYLGLCHTDNENEDGAISAFLKCNNLDPYDLDALLHLGVSYTNEIDSGRALRYLRRWIVHHPDYSSLAEENDLQQGTGTLIASDAFENQQEHQKVVTLFNRALDINAMDSDLHIVLGVLYNITSEFDIAENHFKKAIECKPHDASLWNKLGATQANGGKSEDAIQAYTKALQMKPNYVRALSNMGIAFANLDKHQEACQSYLMSLKLNPAAVAVWDYLKMSLLAANRLDLVDLCQQKDVKLFEDDFDI